MSAESQRLQSSKGIVRHVFSDMMNVQRHIAEALKVVQSIAQQ